MTESPLSPTVRKKRRLALYMIGGGIVVLSLLLILGALLALQFVSEHGLTEPIDRKFGDQYLKSAVAMLELHRIRFGKYPDSLRGIKYTGEWDQIWLGGMIYYPSDDRQSYYVEVRRGWVGKPTLKMPDEFWQNTGYDEKLRPNKK